MKKIIRLTESELKGIIKQAINELSYQTYANAASAAKDREKYYRKSPDYPKNAIRNLHMKYGELNAYQWIRDIEHRKHQETQAEKFYNEAFAALSREICGEDNFYDFAKRYISKYGNDYKIQTMMKKYKEGVFFIENTPRGWSGKNKKPIDFSKRKEKWTKRLKDYLKRIWDPIY